MRLRLYHHTDGARVAYREAGVGPSLCLLHSASLSHREFVPVVEHLVHRFRLVIPDLPAHGASEDRPVYPYTQDWLAEVMAAFCREVCGRHPLVGGHGAGAEILLRAVVTGQLAPSRLVLMPSRLHASAPRARMVGAWRTLAPVAALPGVDRVASRLVCAVHRPEQAMRLTARGNPGARDLARHATDGVAGNANLIRSWSRWMRRWPAAPQAELLDAYPRIDGRVLLLWADQDRAHPESIAEEALELLPDALLRVLPGTGFLMAYDDPVGMARELSAFCGSA